MATRDGLEPPNSRLTKKSASHPAAPWLHFGERQLIRKGVFPDQAGIKILEIVKIGIKPAHPLHANRPGAAREIALFEVLALSAKVGR